MFTKIILLLNIIIYLVVNGQVFAKPIHLCQEMAMHNISATSSTDTLQIHQHHDVNAHDKADKQSVDKLKISSSMNNCQCVDCDCSANLVSQANLTLLSRYDLVSCFAVIQQVTNKLAKVYVSEPKSNLYRPPIFS
jgi:hypothetical protein|tara:strand:+ start:17827 stop:18234 length:408 start_codon:yes stop_codon:yes gene_type:complete